jgi:DNA polymerase-3 subunit beta
MTLSFSAPQEALYAALKAAGRAVASRAPMPVLHGVLLAADERGVEVTGYDLAVGISASFAAEVTGQGRVVAPYRLLADLVGRLPAGSVVTVADDGRKLLLGAPGASYALACRDDAEDWPALPVVGAGGWELDLPLAPLQDTLGRVVGATAAESDESKGTARGVSMALEAGTLHLLATDGHRASWAELPGLGGEAADLNVIVTSRMIREIEKLAGDSEALISLSVQSGLLSVAGDDFHLIGNLLDGDYPGVRAWFPTKFAWIAEFDSDILGEAVERASVIAGETNQAVVFRYTAADQSITVSVENESGNGVDVVAVSCATKKDIQIAFNPKYVLSALKNVEGKRLELCMNEPLKPVVIRSAAKSMHRYMVVPVNIEKAQA